MTGVRASGYFAIRHVRVRCLRRLNRPNRSWSSRDFPSQLDNALHGRKDKNAHETGLVWLVDHLDEVCNKWSLFPCLRSTYDSFPDPPSAMSGNRLLKPRELWKVPIAVISNRLAQTRKLATERLQCGNARIIQAAQSS